MSQVKWADGRRQSGGILISFPLTCQVTALCFTREEEARERERGGRGGGRREGGGGGGGGGRGG